MNPFKIAILNASTVVPAADFVRTAAALQIQADRDFGPAWEKSADIGVVGNGGTSPTPDPGAALLVILDDSDQAGALGYHDITAQGMPIGKVFARTDQRYNLSWAVTASHELLEMIADPWINDCVISPDGMTLYAREVCDACEDDSFAYGVDVGDGGPPVLVSDFVLPPWFGSPGASFDFGGHIGSPFQLLTGGYIGFLDLNNPGVGWQQLFGDAEKAYRQGRGDYASKSRFRLRGRPHSARRVATAS